MSIHSRTFFAIRNFNIPNKKFGNHGHKEIKSVIFRKILFSEMRKIIKEIIGVPPTTPKAYKMYTGIKDVGVGEPCGI